MTFTTAQKLIAEAIGTCLLVATVVGSGIMAEQLADGNVAIALLGNTIATGAILYVLITALGPISGAHFNPAVSLVFAFKKDTSWSLAGLFALVQIAGAIAGTLLAHGMFDQTIIQVSTNERSGPSQWLSEMVATFALLFAILMTLRVRPEAVPTAVALVITAGYWFTASTSFANPAVTIGRAFTDTFSGIAPGDVVLFIVSQFIGAVLAWLVCDMLLRPTETHS
ncbi:MAG: MIP/aquaporin family protein [Pseudomonadota bacterium]